MNSSSAVVAVEVVAQEASVVEVEQLSLRIRKILITITVVEFICYYPCNTTTTTTVLLITVLLLILLPL